jgi:hypothetical protein
VKTSPKRSYSVIQNERIGLVFAKTVSIISGTGLLIQEEDIPIPEAYNCSPQPPFIVEPKLSSPSVSRGGYH